MDKATHDILKKENEILKCEHSIENKVNIELIILIVMLVMETPSCIYYLLKLLWKQL